MTVLLLVGSALLLVTLHSWSARKADNVRVRRLLAEFGAPVDRERDLSAAAWFCATRKSRNGARSIDDRTWSDLDMDDVWRFLDRTVSQVGAQCQYATLRFPWRDANERALLETLAEFLRASPVVRTAVVRELDRLRASHVCRLPDVLAGDALPGLARPWLIGVMSVVPIGLLLVTPWWPRVLVVVLVALVVNYLVRMRLRPTIDQWLPAIRALPLLLDVAERLARLDATLMGPVTGVLRTHLPQVRAVRRAARWLSFEGTGGQPVVDVTTAIVAAVWEYVNFALLVELLAFHLISRRAHSLRAELTAIFESVGLLDVALSVASVRTEWDGQWCAPIVSASLREVHVIDVRHPLVVAAVPNDVIMTSRSWVITGSNMSGKSTFLRAVGVNALLASTIQTCRSTCWSAPPFAVRSLIGRSDSLLDGTSYFMAEIKAVQELLATSEREPSTLFVIDELFRGTNTVERIAAGRAVLEALDSGSSLVMVATHDMELQELLSPRFDSRHFAEHVTDGCLVFDHRLREGPVSTRNAIALLRHAGVSADIVKRAEESTREVRRA